MLDHTAISSVDSEDIYPTASFRLGKDWASTCKDVCSNVLDLDWSFFRGRSTASCEELELKAASRGVPGLRPVDEHAATRRAFDPANRDIIAKRISRRCTWRTRQFGHSEYEL